MDLNEFQVLTLFMLDGGDPDAQIEHIRALAIQYLLANEQDMTPEDIRSFVKQFDLQKEFPDAADSGLKEPSNEITRLQLGLHRVK